MTLFPRFVMDTSFCIQNYESVLHECRIHIHNERHCQSAAADIVKAARLHYALGVTAVEITLVDDGDHPSIDVRPHVPGAE